MCEEKRNYEIRKLTDKVGCVFNQDWCVNMVKKVIVINTTEEKYKTGRSMVICAEEIADIHGCYNRAEALRVFGEKGWLRPWEELENLDDFIERKSKKKIDKAVKNAVYEATRDRSRDAGGL